MTNNLKNSMTEKKIWKDRKQDDYTNMNNSVFNEDEKLEIILNFAKNMLADETEIPKKYIDFVDNNIGDLLC